MVNVEDRSLVLIQCRFNSRRLTGKALFTIEGLPIVALVALRASNTGKEVLVLTSNEPSDDEICKVLEKYDIKYFRGSLDNVLERFNQALLGQPDERIIFRLTADNVLPDGIFLDELEIQFRSNEVEIMSCSPKLSNLAYGISAEVMRVKSIREAFKNSENEYDKEHVTPYIHRNGRHLPFRSKNFMGYNNFRVTIDTYDDYISVKSLFKGVKDVVNMPMHSLIHNFSKMQYRPFYEASSKPMTLGTVQLGLNYGITNSSGKTKKEDAIEIIKNAITEGVEYIDTAAVYGDSELILGEALLGGWRDRVKLITKLCPFESNEYSDDRSWSLTVRNSFYESCLKLNTRKLDVLMFHRYSNALIPAVLSEVLKIKDDGGFEKLGASVQSPSELELALDNKNITFIQLPFNILDYRWSHLIDKILKVKEERGLIVHARSSLLQGLLCSKDSSIWLKTGISNSQEVIDWLEMAFKKYEKMSVSDLCIGYVNSQVWIDSVVIGVDSISNLYSNLQSISMPLFSSTTLDDIVKTKPKVNVCSLDPSSWS